MEISAGKMENFRKYLLNFKNGKSSKDLKGVKSVKGVKGLASVKELTGCIVSLRISRGAM